MSGGQIRAGSGGQCHHQPERLRDGNVADVDQCQYRRAGDVRHNGTFTKARATTTTVGGNITFNNTGSAGTVTIGAGTLRLSGSSNSEGDQRYGTLECTAAPALNQAPSTGTPVTVVRSSVTLTAAAAREP